MREPEVFPEYSEKVEHAIRSLKQEKEFINNELFRLRVMRRTWEMEMEKEALNEKIS